MRIAGWLFWSSLGAAMLLAPGCSSSRHTPEERYYLVACNIKLPYWQEAGAGLSKSAARLQVRAEMVGPDTYDPKAQVEEFRRVVQKKPSGILVSPADPKLFQPEIDAAMQAGIPVITVDSDSPESKRWLFIGTNNYQAGLMGGRTAARLLQGKGNVVVYTMPGQANLAERLSGYKEVFAAYPQIKIAEVVDIKGDPRVAFDRTKEILEKQADKVNGFICLEASACEEVAEVLDRKKVTDKVVVAMDTDQATLEAIQKGLIGATIAQRTFTMAFFGLTVLDDLHHQPLPVGPRGIQAPLPDFVDTGAILVDKSNVAEFLRK